MADIRVTRRFEAPAEKVFDAWLDPALARKFLFATPDGEMVKAEIDARVGGRFNFTDRRPEVGEVEHVGAYETIDRPHRLAFTFAVPKYDPAYTRVVIDIVPEGAGCELTLTQTGVLDEWKDEVPKGWAMILDGLETLL